MHRPFLFCCQRRGSRFSIRVAPISWRRFPVHRGHVLVYLGTNVRACYISKRESTPNVKCRVCSLRYTLLWTSAFCTFDSTTAHDASKTHMTDSYTIFCANTKNAAPSPDAGTLHEQEVQSFRKLGLDLAHRNLRPFTAILMTSILSRNCHRSFTFLRIL